MTVNTQDSIEIVGRERLTPALEVAKKYVSTKGSRPALQHVALMPNGEMHATDSYVALILKNVHTYQDIVLLNPKTLDLIKGYNYPDISRLLGTNNTIATIEFNRRNIESLLKVLTFVKKNFQFKLKVKVSTDEIELSETGTRIVISNDETWTINEQAEEVPIVASFTKDHLLLVFETFLKFSQLETITMHYQSAMRPFIFKNEDMQIAVLPVRTYD